MAQVVTKLPPSNYVQPYIDQHVRVWCDMAWTVSSADGDIEPLVEDPDTNWRTLEPLMEQIEAGQHDLFTSVARVEFIWDQSPLPDANNMRAAVLFDFTGAVIVSVANALLGYNGNGPDLSWKILDSLDVPRAMFDEMQVETKNSRPYVVMVSRETPSGPHGDEAIVTHDEPLRGWTWWRAR